MRQATGVIFLLQLGRLTPGAACNRPMHTAKKKPIGPLAMGADLPPILFNPGFSLSGARSWKSSSVLRDGTTTCFLSLRRQCEWSLSTHKTIVPGRRIRYEKQHVTCSQGSGVQRFSVPMLPLTCPASTRLHGEEGRK